MSNSISQIKLSLFKLLLFCFILSCSNYTSASMKLNLPPINWNTDDILWYDYMDGLIAAKRTKKPSIIVVYGDWCKYCKKYSKLFKDSEVIKAMRSVIAIKIDVDSGEKGGIDWATRNGLQGQGVPRTFALDKSFEFILNPRSKNKGNFYFYWTEDKARFLRFIDIVTKS